MDLVTDDPTLIERLRLQSGGSVPAVHQPLPADWQALGLRGEGSGGTLVPEVFAVSSGSYILLTTAPQDPLRMRLERIESAFCITREELADVCRTTRKTVYNWLNQDSEPQAKNRQRLFELDVLAEDWLDAGYTQERDQLHKPLIDGKSVMDLLTDERLDRELVLFAGSRLAISNLTGSLKDPFST